GRGSDGSGEHLGDQQHDQSHENDRARESLFHQAIHHGGPNSCNQAEYIRSHSSAGPTVYTEPKTRTRSPAFAVARAISQTASTVAARVMSAEGRPRRRASSAAGTPRGPGSEQTIQ